MTATPNPRRLGVAFCPTCQQPLPPPPVLCGGCGHPVTSHHMISTGALSWCSRYDQAGRCPCEAFSRPKEAQS